MAFKNLLFISLLVVISACSQKNATVPVKLKIFKSNLATGVPLNGGIILTGNSEDGLESFRMGIANANQDLSLDLKKGKWEFTAVGWSGEAGIMTGQTRCANSGVVDLKDTEATVNFNLTQSRCLSPYGSQAHTFTTAGSQYVNGDFYKLQPVLCINASLNTSTCAPALNSSIYKSYRVIFSADKKGTLTSTLPELPSACQLVGATPAVTIPAGDNSGTSALGFRFVFYTTTSCTGTSVTENFNTSLKHGTTGNSLRALENNSVAGTTYLFINPGAAAALSDVQINTTLSYTASPNVNVSFSTLPPDVTELCFAELSDGSDCIGPSWITILTSPRAVTLAPGDGTKTVYLYAKNSSSVVTLVGQDSIILDTSFPAFNGAATFQAGYNSSPVPLTWPSFTDLTTVHYNIYNCGTNSCSSGCVSVATAIPSPNFNFSPPSEGTYNICLEGVDAIGNQSLKSYVGTFEYDTVAPTISSFQLNSNIAATNSLNLSFNSSVAGLPDKMCINGTSSIGSCIWTAYISSGTHLLSPGDGLRDVYLHVKDIAGNISSANTPITVDTMAPTTPGMASVNPFYNSSQLPLGFNWGASTDAHLSRYDIKVCASAGCSTSCGPERSTVGVTPSDTIAFADGVVEGMNHICLRAVDTVGNSSPFTSAASFTYDSIAPVTGGVTLMLAGGSAYTKTTTVNWTITGSIDATQMCMSVSSTAGSCSPWTAVTSSGTVTLPNTEGPQTLYTFYKDAALNISSSQMNSITLDTIPPAAISLSSPQVGLEIEGNKAEFTYSGGTDVNFDKVVAKLCSDAGCGTVYATADLGAGPVSSSLIASGNSWPVGTSAVVVLKAYDLAGNYSGVTASPSIMRIYNLKVKEMAFGETHICFAFSNGTAKCMGQNSMGQLGRGNTSNLIGNNPSIMGNNLPLINFDGFKVRQIAAGGYGTCAILSNGQLRCWGANTSGQLGLGDTANRNLPTPTEVGPRPAIQVALSETHTCIVNADGDVKCFGSNTFGELGLGHTTNIGVTSGQMGTGLVSVNLGTNKKAIKVGVGNGFSCALLSDRTVKCWGKNDSGQLGLDNTITMGDGASEMGDTLPTLNLGASEGVIDLSVASDHSCVLLASGIAKCWGMNTQGQLGTGTTTGHGAGAGSMSALAGINFGSGKKAIQITAGTLTTCAVLEDGTSKCWGSNYNGVGGQGNAISTLMDPAVLNLDLGTGATVRSIASGSDNACAILANGNVKCWGYSDGHGQGVPQTLGTSPGQMGDALPFVRLGTTTILDPMKMASGDSHNCALMYNGLVKCWGSNNFGQLGINIPGGYKGVTPSEMGANLPFLEFGGSKFVRDISSGGFGSNSTCVQMSNGEMKCWGRNIEGQLGITQTTAPKDIIGDDAGEVSASMPAISFPSSKKVRSMNVGADTTCAIMVDGSIYCFGQNSIGQCGIENSTPSIPNPSTMNMLPEKAIQITLGQGHACALTALGTVKCWGHGSYGQLGNNATATLGTTASSMSSLTAIDMGASAKAIKIDAGKFSTCALLDNRKVKCWGDNTNGVLGQDTNIGIGQASGNAVALAPAVIFMSTTALSTAVDVETNGLTTCALVSSGVVRCWGDNTNGMLGQNSSSANMGTSSFPTIAGNIIDSVLGSLSPVEKLTVGMNGCAISVHGPGICWGNNSYGQAGQGTGAPNYGTSGMIMPTTPINL